MHRYDRWMLPPRRTSRALLALYAVVAVLIVIATLFPTSLDRAIGWMAPLLLAEILVISSDPPRSRLVWLGTAGFALVAAAAAAELIEQIPALEMGLHAAGLACWLVALWPLRSGSVLSYRRGWLVLYALVGGIAIFAAASGSGLTVPVSIALIVVAVPTAILATSLGLTGVFGGAGILLAHTLTVLFISVPAWHLPGIPVWIAALFLGGSGLLACGFVKQGLTDG